MASRHHDHVVKWFDQIDPGPVGNLARMWASAIRPAQPRWRCPDERDRLVTSTPGSRSVFRVARRLGAPLPELLEVFEADALVAGQMEKG